MSCHDKLKLCCIIKCFCYGKIMYVSNHFYSFLFNDTVNHAYVMWPFAKRVQNWIVDRSTAHDFMLYSSVNFCYVYLGWALWNRNSFVWDSQQGRDFAKSGHNKKNCNGANFISILWGKSGIIKFEFKTTLVL